MVPTCKMYEITVYLGKSNKSHINVCVYVAFIWFNSDKTWIVYVAFIKFNSRHRKSGETAVKTFFKKVANFWYFGKNSQI